MKNILISTIISVFMSFALLSGIEALHNLVFYLMVVINILAWLAVFCVPEEYDEAAHIRNHVWICLASSAFSIYALVFTGHPALATSSFMVSFFILISAYRKPDTAIYEE